MDDNVIPLKPLQHLTIDVFEQRHGWLAEGRMNGQLLWEFETDSMSNLVALIGKTVGRMKND